MQTLRPDLAKEWDNLNNGRLKPEQVTLGSSRRVWWLCERKHSFVATVVARVNGGRCPYCIGKRPILGETDFKTIHPELMIEWDFEKNGKLCPEDYTCGSHKKIWWRCKEGHSWQTMIYDHHYGSQCPTCQSLKDRHIITVGLNDLATTHPTIAAQWDYDKNKLTPQQVMPGSNKKIWCKCKRGHSWLTSVLARTNGSQCPRCNGKTHTRTKFIT